MSRQRTSTPPQIIDEASEWFVLMRDPEVSTESRDAFSQWLRASPAHVGVYLEIARLWGDSAHIAGEYELDDTSRPAGNVIELNTHARELPEAEGAPGVTRRSHDQPAGLKRFAAAASVVGVMLAVALIAGYVVNRPPTYAADIGEQRVITLEDGSTVKLNSRSAVSVRMSAEQRRIELLEGQALFQVAHDTARPFIVTSGNAAIRAVGTQFDVNQRQSGTVVTVVEGKVRIDTVESSILSKLFVSTPAPTLSLPAARTPDQTQGLPATEQAEDGTRTVRGELLLAAGEQLLLAQNGTVELKEKPDTAAAISWLQQELRFDGQLLTDVLEEFNRYTRTPMVLGDPSLGTLRINAVFHTTSPDSLLKFISRMEDIQIEKTEKEIRISKRP